ncbi:hypothetical protein ACFV3E_44945 [Streptomyces sp. NPDC059718]
MALQGRQLGCDLCCRHDALEDLVRPLWDRPVPADHRTLALGHTGVHSSFPRHAEAATALYGVDVRYLLREVGRPGGGATGRRARRHNRGYRSASPPVEPRAPPPSPQPSTGSHPKRPQSACPITEIPRVMSPATAP